MTNLKTLAFSGLILSLAAGGWAHAQSVAPTPPPPPAAAPSSPPATAQEPSDDDDMALPDSDLDDEDDDGGPNADAENGRRSGHMGRMDENDGIGKDEFQAGRLDRLKAADKNGDGTLSMDELESMILKRIVERRAERLADRLDINGDGKVTLAELQTLRDKRFALLDRNDDGRIDDRELALIHRGMGRHGMGGPGMGGRGMGNHGMDGHGEMRVGDRGEDRNGGYGRRGEPGDWRERGERHGWHDREAWRYRDHGRDRMPDADRDFD